MSNGAELQAKAIRLFEEKKFAEAGPLFADAMRAYQEAGDEVLAAEMQVNLGLTKRELEAYEEAIELMQSGLALFRAKQNRLREAQTLGNMALAYAKLQDQEQAQAFYREAAAIFKDIGEDDSYGETILALGDLYFRGGEYMRAVALFEMGLEHIKNKNHRQKMLKQLLLMKNRMLGERKEKQKVTDGEETPSDSRRRRRRRLFGSRKGELPEGESEEEE